MSDEGERICPLCAEAMDLTDQQLKPCKCGYEICVWCWHHIMEMAEKQEMEGRCPACRTPYDKDRIVGMSSKCEKLVAEMNGEKKTRSQKARSKSMSEARKHLGSVRVIQRNLVYIIGLPLNSCDENVLQRREYFGQYGKILKVSVSRPSTGTQAAQQAPSSNTFNVYITYTKEEEAIRCIQAVHNFVLDGKQLRACFGTTKYCHAWLRNMPCNNPDCFYLHDVGSQEDSFTKDEIISAYTRTRVPQISSNSSHRRLGNVLPPPADDFNNVAKSSAKSAVKISSNSCASAKIPPTCSSLPRSAALPAAASWGSRLSNSASSIPCSNLTSKKKQENPLISLISASSKQSTVLHKDLVERGDPSRKGEMGSKNANTNVCGPSKDCVDVDSGNGSNLSTDIDYVRHTSAWHNDDALPSAKVPEGNLGVNSNGRSWSSEGSELCADRDRPKMSSPSLPDLALDENILSSWDEDDNDETCISSKMIEGKQAVHLDDTNLPVGHSNSGISKDYESNEAHSSERSIKPASNSDNVTSSSAHAIEEKEDVIFEWINDSSVGCSREWDLLHTGIGDAVLEDAMNNKQNMQTLSEGMASLKISSSNVTYINGMYRQESKSNEGLLPPEMQKLSSELPIDGSASLLSRETPNMVRNTHFSRGTSEWITEQWKQPPNGNTVKDNLDIPGLSVSDIKCGNPGFADQTPSFPHSGHSIEIREHQRNLHEGDHYNTQLSGDAMSINPRSTDISSLFMPDTGYQQKGPLSIEGEPLPDGTPSNVANRDMRESSIISNILSLDVNPWDVSSPNDFVKLLSETNKQIDGLQLSSLLKGQSSSSGNNQSRFPFARMESHSNYMEPFHNENGLLNTRYLDQSLVARGLDDSASQFRNGNPLFSYDNTSVLPRTSASAPPGFSHPNRLPPPGFSSQNRLSLTYETSRAYQIPASSIPSNQGQVCLTENSGDVEFIDPAILAVGKGRMPFESNRNLLPQSFPTHANAIENDRSHLLLQQQSASALQDCMISGLVGNMCLPSKDAYVSSQFIAQNNVNVPHFTDMSSLNMHLSKSNWDSWNEAQSRNDLCNINDLHMLENLNELFGLNKYFPGGREHEFLYNRAFGM